jgi:hypothetical protein
LFVSLVKIQNSIQEEIISLVKIQNSIQDEIMSRLKSENACYHLAQNLLSSRLLFENVRIKLLAPQFGIQILAQPVCKMRIIQEPKKVAL